jgi:hypothetical protein
VPLSKIQTDVLGLLASHRDPESYVAGSTPLNRETPRYSGNIDVFHDREELVARAAAEDAAVLEEHGYTLQWQRREPAIYAVLVGRSSGEVTRLEWVVDSDFRFFPTMRDEMFGYVLHPVDLAMNKTMAAVNRREVRDLVDLVTIHETILPLGALTWAAVEKAPGFTPEGLIAEILRSSSYSSVEWRALMTSEPLDPKAIVERLRAALDEAEAFVMKMPTGKAGLLFLKSGHVVQPNPARFEDYRTHAGQRRGHWPTSAEISAAMFERYKKPPTP